MNACLSAGTIDAASRNIGCADQTHQQIFADHAKFDKFGGRPC